MVATSGRFVDDDLQDEVDNTLSALYELPLTSQLVSPMLHTVSEVRMCSYTTVLCSPRRSCITVLLLTGRSCRTLVSHVPLIPPPYTAPVNCFACFNATAISLCLYVCLCCRVAVEGVSTVIACLPHRLDASMSFQLLVLVLC